MNTLKHLVAHMVTYLGLLLASTSGLAAQEGVQDTFGETVDVRVINLEVVVTDRKQQRVTGLSPDDFRLRIDGDTIPIAYFSEVDDGRVREQDTSSLARAPNADLGARVPVHYLLFVDRFFSFEVHQRQLLDALEKSLSLLEADDRMAVVAYSGRDIETLSGWTASQPQLGKAFRDILEGPFGGNERAWEEYSYRSATATREEFLAEGDDPLLGGIADGENPGLQSRKKNLEGQLDLVSRAVTASMQGFASPRGRKVLLLFSGGWSKDTITHLTGTSSGAFGNPISKAIHSLRRITSTANLLGYTIYPVDVPENRLGSTELEQHASLDFLATETGGRPFKNYHGLEALHRVTEDIRSYYWMGFSPPWSGDGKDHKIDIEVLRPGLEIRSKKNFRDVPPNQQINEWVASTTLLGSLPGADSLDLAWGPIQKVGRKRVQVPLEITLPLESVVMLPSAEGFTANLEIRISALDSTGTLNDIEVIPFIFSGERPPSPGSHVVYDTSLQLRDKPHDVVVVVYDQASGNMISGRQEFVP